MTTSNGASLRFLQFLLPATIMQGVLFGSTSAGNEIRRLVFDLPPIQNAVNKDELIRLLTDAEPDDGLLDVALITPRKRMRW